MAVKGKKVQKQQKPVPKLVKPSKEEEEELEDEVDEEDLEEQSDDDDDQNQDAEEDDENLEEEDDDDDDEEDEVNETKQNEEKPGSNDAEDDKSMQTTIFVGHISYQLTPKELNDFFAKAGEIESSRIIPKRGYAFVTYKEEASVVEALKLNKQVLSGKPVHVERVKSKRSDNQNRQAEKRKHNKDQNEKGAKKPKMEGKTVNPKGTHQFKGGKGKAGKGKPKTAQRPHPNKKQNKPAAGKFVKPTA